MPANGQLPQIFFSRYSRAGTSPHTRATAHAIKPQRVCSPLLNSPSSSAGRKAGLNKSQRLRTPEEFRSVYKSKQFGVSELHSFNIRARDCGPSRLGVTVSKKVSKLAVQRNQIRRRIKEFYRLHQHQLVSADVVITAKANCSNATAAEQWQSLQQLWEKLLKWQRWHQANH